jgi:hypothetical protein
VLLNVILRRLFIARWVLTEHLLNLC